MRRAAGSGPSFRSPNSPLARRRAAARRRRLRVLAVLVLIAVLLMLSRLDGDEAESVSSRAQPSWASDGRTPATMDGSLSA